MSNLRCIVIIFLTNFQTIFQYTQAQRQLMVNAEKQRHVTFLFQWIFGVVFIRLFNMSIMLWVDPSTNKMAS